MGFDSGRITSCPGVSLASAASSAKVRPVTVNADPSAYFTVGQALRDHRHPAGFIDIDGDESPGGFQIDQQRRA
jgi:hypothetical protein